jgi:hypothetical protein
VAQVGSFVVEITAETFFAMIVHISWLVPLFPVCFGVDLEVSVVLTAVFSLLASSADLYCVAFPAAGIACSGSRLWSVVAHHGVIVGGASRDVMI